MKSSITLILLTIAMSWSSVSVAVSEPLRIGSNKQLFIGPFDEHGRDTHLVESMKNVEITMNPARVTGERLLELDKPWEKGEWPLLDMRQFVLKDGDRFRMYYSATSKYPKLWSETNCRILCYAESTDGIHWTKPDLGLVEWNGTRKNNILFPNDDFDYVFSELEGACVFIDPNAAGSADKYKMLAKVTPAPGKVKKLPKGQYLFASPDGIRWRLFSQKKINPRSSDTQFSLFFDDSLNKFVAYTRVKFRPKRHAADFRRQFGDELQPQTLQVGRTVSDDLHNWSKEITVMAQDEADLVGSPPGFDRMHLHGGNVSKYSEAPGVYFAMPNAYYRWKLDMSRVRRVSAGRKHVQLPGSYDVYQKNPKQPAWVTEGLVTRKGTIVLFVTHFFEDGAKRKAGVMRSDDHGATWTDYEFITFGNPQAVVVKGDTCFVLFDGDNDGRKHSHVLYVSTDDGRTWNKRSALSLGKEKWYGTMCIMEDGRLLAGAYHSKDENHLYYYISDDNGHSWSEEKRAYLDKKIRDPELAHLGGRYYLFGRSGMYGEGRERFVMYQSENGENWKSGIITSGEAKGPDGYNDNCIINKYRTDAAEQLWWSTVSAMLIEIQMNTCFSSSQTQDRHHEGSSDS